MAETHRYVPVKAVTGLLEALDGTANEYEQAKVSMAASVIELTEERAMFGMIADHRATEQHRRFVSEWEEV